jgi:hypothetical protein
MKKLSGTSLSEHALATTTLVLVGFSALILLADKLGFVDVDVDTVAIAWFCIGYGLFPWLFISGLALYFYTSDIFSSVYSTRWRFLKWIRGNNLQGASLVGANFTKTNLKGSRMSAANLIGANLRGIDLHESDLSRADLSSACLRGTNLRYSNMHGTRLWSANLVQADLSYANLNGAKCGLANMKMANLHHAKLGGAVSCSPT